MLIKVAAKTKSWIFVNAMTDMEEKMTTHLGAKCIVALCQPYQYIMGVAKYISVFLNKLRMN